MSYFRNNGINHWFGCWGERKDILQENSYEWCWNESFDFEFTTYVGQRILYSFINFQNLCPNKIFQIDFNVLNYFIEVGAESWIQKTENERRHLLSKKFLSLG